ncbi:MAG: DNA translocase FtsK [Candidatus Moranbacteria bacterium]|nr:DNA translocase FtsK [Candidatus Moranbacteria bacterium]
MEPKFDLHGDAKASIAAIFLFALAILFIIGFFGGANVLGSGLNKFGGLLFGWGKWLLPVVLLGLSVVILLRKKMIFYVSKLVGIVMMFLCILTMLHIYLNDGKLLEAAKSGIGGGYSGYFMSKALISLAGRSAGTVILLSVLIIGAIVTFNFSIISFIKNSNWFRRNSDEEDENEEEEDEENEYKNNSKNDEEFDVTRDDLKNNIKKIEFVEDPFSIENEDGNEESGSSLDSKKESDSKPKKAKSSIFGSANWKFPSVNLLDSYPGKAKGGDIEKNKDIIRRTFQHFGIEVESGEAKVGPTVTQYSFRPAVGVKLSRIVSLGNDLSLALAAHPIRIEAPIPGKSLVGVEIPNKEGVVVGLRDILKDKNFIEDGSHGLFLALGRDVEGTPVVKNLAKMPHLLVAGATGTGKSVCVNTILVSLLYQNSPDDLKLILVDPKRVELSLYKGIPHLLSDVIVENSKVVNALKWAVGEMERRYILFQETGSKDLNSYRSKVEEGMKRKVIDPETGEKREEELEKMPYIVIVIDELADLMSSHGKEVEGAIIRLAQMARAVGIHLIVSTQRPSVEVLTGLIKANITTRIALQVATQIDSRTILDMSGAEKLLGKGDMLFLSSDSPKPVRVQCAFVSENEIKKVVKAIINKNSSYISEADQNILDSGGRSNSDGIIDFSNSNDGRDSNDDELYEEAKRMVVDLQKASTSLLQRRLRVGYSRAARLVDMLEENGVVGPPEGSKGRIVLIGEEGDEIAYEDSNNDQKERDKWQI